MQNSQPSSSLKNTVRLTAAQRLIAAAVFLVIALGFVTLFAAGKGWIDLGAVFGACGFKQVTGYPCPGCGITTSLIALSHGHLFSSFYIQPAGAILGICAIAVGVFSLLIALFGVDFGLLTRLKPGLCVKVCLVALVIILMGGWAVTLTRAWIENRSQ